MSILESPPFQRALALLLTFTAALGGVGAGCSLVVESRSTQCQTDDDCSGFENATCDVAGGVCVARESSGTASCVGPDGCFACPPTSQVEFLTACTDSACVPYDNAQLEGLLQEDGSLPPVP